MYLTSRTVRTIAWSALTLSAARAQYIIDNLSFGHKEGPISPDYTGIPHFTASEGEYEVQILSDRAILTPPWPGNRRGSIWAQDALRDIEDWTAELDFRATGMDRGGGNLQLWYTKTSQANDAPNSLYTAPKFDGLVIVVDQYEGRGGSIRAFLNDGTIDIKAHPDPDTLAFGQCTYAYRNLGRLSTLKLHHAHGMLEVKIDGNLCFKTDKVKLPDGYRFGITASSAENPDSWEVHRFFVSTTNSHWRHDEHQSFQSPDQQQQQQQNLQGNDQQQQQQQHDPQVLNDVLASTIRSQQDQFADLHNRIQILNHRVNSIYDLVEKINKDNEHRFNDLMSRVVPMDDRTAAVMRNVEKVERTTMEVLRDLESKDFKDMLNQVHNAIESSHNAMAQSMPVTMAHIVGSQKPSLTHFLFIAVAVQIMVVGAYMAYKKRRNSAPKKYL